MKKVAQFFIVSKEEFIKDCQESAYKDILLPSRATKGSAGYDFFAPFDISLKSGETIKIPTGIRVKIDEGWVLKIYPRSSLAPVKLYRQGYLHCGGRIPFKGHCGFLSIRSHLHPSRGIGPHIT